MTKKWAEDLVRRIAGEIQRLRGTDLGERERKRTGQWLSDRTDELGYRVSRTTISEIENSGRKSLSVAELVVLAEAVGVDPLSVLYPGPPDQLVEYLPGEWVTTAEAKRRFGVIVPRATVEAQISTINQAVEVLIASQGVLAGTAEPVVEPEGP